MDNGKVLELALNFQSAPAELKTAAAAYRTALFDSQKSEKQVALWIEEKKVKREELIVAEREFQKQLNSWDPAGIQDLKPVVRGGE